MTSAERHAYNRAIEDAIGIINIYSNDWFNDRVKVALFEARDRIGQLHRDEKKEPGK